MTILILCIYLFHTNIYNMNNMNKYMTILLTPIVSVATTGTKITRRDYKGKHICSYYVLIILVLKTRI